MVALSHGLPGHWNTTVIVLQQEKCHNMKVSCYSQTFIFVWSLFGNQCLVRSFNEALTISKNTLFNFQNEPSTSLMNTYSNIYSLNIISWASLKSKYNRDQYFSLHRQIAEMWSVLHHSKYFAHQHHFLTFSCLLLLDTITLGLSSQLTLIFFLHQFKVLFVDLEPVAFFRCSRSCCFLLFVSRHHFLDLCNGLSWVEPLWRRSSNTQWECKTLLTMWVWWRMVMKECLYCMYSVNASKCKLFFPLFYWFIFRSTFICVATYVTVNERMLILYIKNIEGKDLCVCVLCNYLGASLGTVHDSVAAVEREGVLKFRQTFLSEFITRVNHPPICLWDNHTVVICSIFSFLILGPVVYYVYVICW